MSEEQVASVPPGDGTSRSCSEDPQLLELAAGIVRELSARCPACSSNEEKLKHTCSRRCACGVPCDTDPRFHKRSACHDCEYHFRRSCGWCASHAGCRDASDTQFHWCRGTVERLIAGCEARLYVEAIHGPFVTTNWES